MEITYTTVQTPTPVAVVRVKGNLDSGTAGYFNDEVKRLVDGGVKNVLLDFSGVPYMSSVGIRCLSALFEWLHPFSNADEKRSVSQQIHAGNYHAPHLKLLNPNERVVEVLHIIGLDSYLDIFDDEKTALKSF